MQLLEKMKHNLNQIVCNLSPNQADNKKRPPSERNTVHLDALLHVIKSMGISLNVWRSKDAGKKLEWTSLLGGEKRSLLRKLPAHFNKILPPQRAPVVQKLWTVSVQ